MGAVKTVLRDRASVLFGGDAHLWNVTKAVVAVAWTFSGRALGLVWTAAMLANLGLADYGLYSIAWSVSAVIALTVDHPFAVRAIRIDDRGFVRERTARILVGLGIIVGATMAYAVGISYVIWFGLGVAGCEILLASVLSRATRMGQPQRATRASALRQAVSVVLGVGVFMAVDDATLVEASLGYLLPYVVFVLLAIRLALTASPQLPGPIRPALMMSAENFSNAVYMQGDILLLGVLADARTVGIYALASAIAWAFASLGQMYGQTHHDSLRASGGSLAHGPSTRNAVLLGAAGGAAVLLIAVGMAVFSAGGALVAATAVMALFVTARVLTFVLSVVLYVQGRDRVRVVSSAACASLKLAAVAILVTLVFPADLAAPAAAIAALIAELIMCTWLYRVLYRRDEGQANDRG